MERLKGKFTQRWLADSDLYYCPIFERLFYAQFNYLQRKGIQLKPEHLNKLSDEEALLEAEAEGNEYRALFTIQGGLDEFHHLAESIDALNRGFITLLEAARPEPLAAMPLVRLQLDNLTYLAAELKYPFRVLYKVFNKGRRLSQITIQKEALNPTKIRKELDAKNGYNLCELYDKYSSFVHPDKAQTELNYNVRMRYKFGQEVLSKAQKKNLCNDMITINRIIAVLLQCQIFAYNVGLKDDITAIH